MKCLNCDILIEESSTKPKKFCSDKCRKAFNRRENGQKKTDKKITDTIKTEETDKKFKERIYTLEEVCTPAELKDFPNMCLTRKMYNESIYRLENNDIEDLRKAGIYIPAKYNN